MNDFKKVLKHNPNHDHRGRFASAPGAKTAPAPKKDHAALTGVHAKSSQAMLDRGPRARGAEAYGEPVKLGGPSTLTVRGKPVDLNKVAPTADKPKQTIPAQTVLDGSGYAHLSREEAARREAIAAANTDPFASMFTGETSHVLPTDLVFFHGTASSCVASIQKEGLIAGKGKGADSWAMARHKDVYDEAYANRTPSVFVSTSPVRAIAFAKLATTQNPGSQMALLEVKIPRDKVSDLKPDEYADMAYRYEGKVDPSWISVINPADVKQIVPLAHSAGLDGDMVDVNKADTVSFYVVVPCKP